MLKRIKINNDIILEIGSKSNNSCSKCKSIYERDKTYCTECIYTRGGKKHSKGEYFILVKKISDNPTCKNLSSFKSKGDKYGKSKS